MESNYREKKQRRSDNRLKAPSEYKEKIVDLRRVTRVVAGGKRMTFRVTIIVGNEKGKIGVGIGKGLDTPAAIAKAKNYAMKNQKVMNHFWQRKESVPRRFVHLL